MVVELIQQHPHISILVMGLLVSFFVSLVQHFVLDKEKMREIKARQKAIQQEMKDHKDNPTKMMELQKEMMTHTMDTLKHSFKPTLITLVPLLLIFAFMNNILSSTSVGGKLFIFPVWVWIYIGASIVGSIIFRKLFKLP